MLIEMVMKALPYIAVMLAFLFLILLALRSRTRRNTPTRRRDDKVLTVQGIADICDVSSRTVRQWFRDGLPVARIGRTELVRRKDLDAFVDNHITLAVGG